MAMLKYGAAAVAKPSVTGDQWANKVYKTACKDGQCRMKTAKSIIAKYDPKKYLLSHVTIIASVDVDLADPKDPKSNYLIKPEYSQYVNNNGDAWTKGVLKNSYKTFIGGDNFQEHVQIAELSKGKIIDAALREIIVGKDREGKDQSTYYCDILVATDRKHRELVAKIENKELTTLSMGCKIAYSICSKCGKKAVDEAEACEHVRYAKNNMFFDHNGVQRKIAELCGHESDPDSVTFIEASWVRQPAFTGAVLRSFVEPTSDIIAKIETAEKIETYKAKPGDYLKAAMDRGLIAADPVEPPPPPEDVPTTPEDNVLPPPDDSSADGELPPSEGDVPPPVSEEPAPEESDIKLWKKDLKKQVMKQITDEVLNDLSEDKISPELANNNTTLDDTLIKPASVLNKVWGTQKTWNSFIKQRIGSKLDKNSYDKLRYGVHIAMTNSDLTVLKEFGYNKRDFLAVISFLDDCLEKPLPIQIKKTIASLGGTQGRKPENLLKAVVVELGRKLAKDEAVRTVSWLRLLDFYS